MFTDARPESNPFFARDEVKKDDTKDKIKRFVIDVVQSVVIALSISVFLYIFIITPNEVDGPSMEPNFYTGQLLFTSKLHDWFNNTSFGDKAGFKYGRGDIIVFQKPGNDDFVKRVIGLPGETISIKDGQYFINGDLLEEDYDLDNDLKKGGTFLVDGEPAKTIPADSYFVSGDHRDVSYDSRSIGFIKEEWIKGKVVFRFWPINEIGFVKSGKSALVEVEPNQSTEEITN